MFTDWRQGQLPLAEFEADVIHRLRIAQSSGSPRFSRYHYVAKYLKRILPYLLIIAPLRETKLLCSGDASQISPNLLATSGFVRMLPSARAQTIHLYVLLLKEKL